MTGTSEWDVDVVSVDLAGEPRRYAASYNPNTSGWFMNQFRQIESDRADRPGWIWVLTDAEDFLPDTFLHELERGDAGLSGRDHEDPQTEYGLSDLAFPTFEITGPSEIAGTWYPREAVDEAIAALRESVDEAWQAAHAANATAALAERRVEQLEEERALIGAKITSGSDEIASLRADLALHEGHTQALVGDKRALESAVSELKDALLEQWSINHAEHCSNTVLHERGDRDCHWPRPEALRGEMLKCADPGCPDCHPRRPSLADEEKVINDALDRLDLQLAADGAGPIARSAFVHPARDALRRILLGLTPPAYEQINVGTPGQPEYVNGDVITPGRAEALCPDCKWPATKNPWGGAGRCPNTAFHEGNG